MIYDLFCSSCLNEWECLVRLCFCYNTRILVYNFGYNSWYQHFYLMFGLLFAKFDASTHYESYEGGSRISPYVLCIYQMPGINRVKVYIWNTEIYLKVYTFMQIIYYITNKLSLQPKHQTLKIWDSVSLFLSYWAIREFFLQRQQKV